MQGAMIEIAPGLRRWTAYHDHWEEQVGSLAVETDDGLLLIDPIDPPRGLRRPDHVLLTVFWHGRSTAELKSKRVWAQKRSAQPLRNRGVQVTDAFAPGDELPGGLEAFATARVNEVVYWLPKQRSLAVGDVLLGAGAKPRATRDALRFCPERCCSCVFASPSALTMLYSTPSASKASSKNRRSSFSHRSELAESGRRTQMLPSPALPPVVPAPSSSSPPHPAAASASAATRSASSAQSRDRRAPASDPLFRPNISLLSSENPCREPKPPKLAIATDRLEILLMAD